MCSTAGNLPRDWINSDTSSVLTGLAGSNMGLGDGEGRFMIPSGDSVMAHKHYDSNAHSALPTAAVVLCSG